MVGMILSASGVRLSDQGVSLVDQGTFTQRVLHRHRDVNQSAGGHRDRRRGIAIIYQSLLLLKVAVVIALGLVFRLGFRASVLAGLLLAPFDEIAYVIFSSAHGSGLLTERAYAMGLTGISFSFVVSPVLINLGYQLVDRFKTETKPDLPLKALSRVDP